MQKNSKNLSDLIIYQTKNGELKLKGDFSKETIWANLNQISKIFGRDKSVISRHIKNIFKEKELKENSVVAFFATTAPDGKNYKVKYFNLDLIISIGYRVNSKKATQFRIWSTKILKQHITKGYTINKDVLQNNYKEFLQSIEELKLLTEKKKSINNTDILELIKTFSNTWFSLEAFDKQKFPKDTEKKQSIFLPFKDLQSDIKILKKELIRQKEASTLFAQEKDKNALEGIWGNIFQTAFGDEVYKNIEEKSAHLLYFIIKNHPFVDGNKRTGSFAFIWFLKKSGINIEKKISPEALTTLALLIAESNPTEKDKMVGLILLILNP